ncbi:MAG TPA: hypothetical protein VFS02_22430 [Telluria sp.]|nr:hypothetical protein [Telluria sp.]
MTPKQREQFNRMRLALRCIAKEFQTTTQLRRSSGDGLVYEERLEYAYENVQAIAKRAVARVPKA